MVSYWCYLICRTFLVLPELDDEVGVWESCKSKLITLPECMTDNFLLTNPYSNSPKRKSLNTHTLYQVSTGDCKTWSLSWLKATQMGNALKHALTGWGAGMKVMPLLYLPALSICTSDLTTLYFIITKQAHNCWLEAARYRISPQSYKSMFIAFWMDFWIVSFLGHTCTCTCRLLLKRWRTATPVSLEAY